MVKHGAIRVTKGDVEIIEKEHYYGSCPHCWAAGPTGKLCQNRWCTMKNQLQIRSLYARDQNNPGSAIHRSIIVYAPVMVMYDDEDHPEHGDYNQDMGTAPYDPRAFILKAHQTGAEIFEFDEDCMVSNLAGAIGCTENAVTQMLGNMGLN